MSFPKVSSELFDNSLCNVYYSRIVVGVKFGGMHMLFHAWMLLITLCQHPAGSASVGSGVLFNPRTAFPRMLDRIRCVELLVKYQMPTTFVGDVAHFSQGEYFHMAHQMVCSCGPTSHVVLDDAEHDVPKL